VNQLRRTRAELARGVALGWHTGAQLYASVGGEVVAELALGQARPGVPMAVDTLVEWGSATKPVTCCALALLWERAKLDLDDPVCRHIPEFAAAGKDCVTIRHLLTHTGGLTEPFRGMPPFHEAVAALCGAPLIEGWVPGEMCGYNSAAMWVVAGLVVRLDGRPFDRFVREEIFEPLGMADAWIGMPVERYRAYGEARFAAVPGVPGSGTAAWVTWGRPTGGGHGPMRDLGRFYAALLQRRLLAPPTIEAMTARHLCGAVDRRTGFMVDWGLGFSLGSSYPGHAYGPHASRRAFGHAGRNWCVAFADPACGLAAAVYWNGRPSEDAHAERQSTLLATLHEELGL